MCNLKHVNAWGFLCSWSLSEGFQLKLLCCSIKFFIFINSDAWDSVVGNLWLSLNEEEVHLRACVCEWGKGHPLAHGAAYSGILVSDSLGCGCGCDSWNTNAATSPFTEVIRTWHQRGTENIRLKKDEFRSCDYAHTAKDPSSSDVPKHSYPFLNK